MSSRESNTRVNKILAWHEISKSSPHQSIYIENKKHSTSTSTAQHTQPTSAHTRLNCHGVLHVRQPHRGVCFLPLGCTWAQAACLLAIWFFPSTCQRTHAYQRGLQASKRKELRPYLSPSVSLCGYCAWVKLVLLFSKSCIFVSLK